MADEIAPSANGNFLPRMEIGNLRWYGQMLDFYVSAMFFLHPSPRLNGRFVEVGAYTGLEFTNTLFFEHYLNWTGWLFEPTTCADLVKANRPRSRVFQRGLCPEDRGKVELIRRELLRAGGGEGIKGKSSFLCSHGALGRQRQGERVPKEERR